MTVRVHLADDHTIFREGLEALLISRGDGIEVVGNKPDVVIAEIDMDLDTAKETLSEIRQASPDSRIVVLTMFDNLRYLKVLSKMGIDAYLHKTSRQRSCLQP